MKRQNSINQSSEFDLKTRTSWSIWIVLRTAHFAVGSFVLFTFAYLIVSMPAHQIQCDALVNRQHAQNATFGSFHVEIDLCGIYSFDADSATKRKPNQFNAETIFCSLFRSIILLAFVHQRLAWWTRQIFTQIIILLFAHRLIVNSERYLCQIDTNWLDGYKAMGTQSVG